MTELQRNIQSYFGVIRPEDLEKIGSCFHPSTLQKGDYFLKAGRPCDKLGFIQSGLLRIYATADGKEITQWISTGGHFVTDLSSLLFESPARWTIQALAETELYTISRTDYKRLGSLLPEWHEFEKLFIARCFTTLEDRMFRHLSMSAEERYEHLFTAASELFNQVPLQHLASMLGMTPETLSRIRKKQLP